jgi:putative membrane protein
MKHLHLLCAIVLLTAVMAGCKKTETYTTDTATDTATMTSDTSTTGTTSTVALNDKDKDFVNSATRGGTAEVELAQDAVSHATNADVKAFAQKLVDDHTKANQELTQFASSRAVMITGEMEAKMKQAKERLLKLTGKSFDQAFVKQMVDDHTATIKMFEEESAAATDPELKSWVDKTLPTLREHLKTAQDLQTKLAKK